MQAYLDISRPAAYELAHREGFPAIRIGRTIRVLRDAFFKWLEAQAGAHGDVYAEDVGGQDAAYVDREQSR